ncbi:hypothetical protein BDR26DRAFT_861922 [Obelidium mucronatum]|nr:hypothetical protein BDR26DRAFT_861922 [Obelidium mucronatum]
MDLEEEEGWNQDSVSPPNDNRQVILPATPHISALQYIATISETPLIEQEGKDWHLEDPALMPTIDEWLVVYRAVSFDGTRLPIRHDSLDADQFIKDFFQLPAFFRTAVVMYCMGPVSLEYYNRARKAVVHSITEQPTYQTVQGLFILYVYVGWKGQPTLVESLLKIMQNLIQVLRLDVDPDFSPWLFHLNLSPRQKEDRRRTFWMAYEAILSNAATSPEAADVPIDSTKIKGPAALEVDGCKVFDHLPLIKALGAVHKVIISIKRQFLTAPGTLQELIGIATSGFQQDLDHARSHIPMEYLFMTESAEELSEQDYTRYTDMVVRLNVLETNTFFCNCHYLAAICILNRPRLYMSGLGLGRHPIYRTPNMQALVSESINTSLDAAHRIMNLSTIFLDPLTCDPHVLEVLPLFEAMIVLWFTSCRMDPIWWTVMGRKKMEWNVLKQRMERLMHRIQKFDSVGGGTTFPLVQCMLAMIEEIDAYEQCFLPGLVQDGIEEITLGMRVVALEEADVVKQVEAPRAYMGLLGMQVGGIRWPGRSEESWRLFWKLQG